MKWLKTFCFGDGAKWAEASSAIRLLKLAALVTGIVAFCVSCRSWMTAAYSQKKAKHYQAWMLIHAARGEGDGGRRDAISELAADGVAMSADFSDVDLRGIRLTNAVFRNAIFRNSHMEGAWFVECDFTKADLSGALLTRGNLQGSKFISAVLSNANFKDAILDGGDFRMADLRGANMDARIKKPLRKQGAQINGMILATNYWAEWIQDCAPTSPPNLRSP